MFFVYKMISNLLRKQIKMAVEKLYESENYLVVNKPYDMYVNSDDPNEKNTVCCHIACPDSHLSTASFQLHFTHRLDYATSGVLCLAKNKKAAAKTGKCFEKRQARKYYLAVVRGLLEGCSDIEYSVGDDPKTSTTNHKMLAVNTSDIASVCVRPRTARTRLLVLETGSYDGDPATVVLLKPFTGRRHQLRVHCLSIGHAILGDFTYSDGVDEAPHRMFLHAMRLLLPIPGEELDIQTNEPFMMDTKFEEKWEIDSLFYKYKTKEEFLDTCDVIDSLSEDDNLRRFYFDL